MFKGFYNLTSGMLTQQRNLTVVADNLVNVSTAGYKESRYLASTFDDVMYHITGNKKKEYTEIGRQSYIRANDEIYINHDQGIIEPTDIPLDFAIYGDGFFAIRTDNGNTVYTRAGSFTLDDEGYLCFPGQGRVLDPNRQPIQLGTDKITADGHGNIFAEEHEEGEDGFLAQLGVFVFGNVGQLDYNEQGMFVGGGGTAADNPIVYWKHLERSNTDMVRQMTQMLTSERSLQSVAQVTKMYDEVMGHAASDVGRM